MKNSYIKTTWIDNKTPVNAANLNKIESALSDLYTNALSSSEILEGELLILVVSQIVTVILQKVFNFLYQIV